LTGEWYAVQTKASMEPWVDRELRRKHFVTYFPFSHEWKPSPKSKTLSELGKRAYFTGYTFVRCDRSSLFIVSGTENVVGIVRAAGGEPCPIDELVMQAIVDVLGPSGKVNRVRERKLGFAGQPGQSFRFGERSKFFGFYAEIVRVLDNERIIARFAHTLFGAAGRVLEVPVADVGELLEEAKTTKELAAYGSPY
jgi:transcription antitermination factor NusG